MQIKELPPVRLYHIETRIEDCLVAAKTAEAKRSLYRCGLLASNLYTTKIAKGEVKPAPPPSKGIFTKLSKWLN